MRWLYILLALSASIFWGLSLSATKLLLQASFTPNLLTFLRFLISAIAVRIIFPKKTFGKIKKGDPKIKKIAL